MMFIAASLIAVVFIATLAFLRAGQTRDYRELRSRFRDDR